MDINITTSGEIFYGGPFDPLPDGTSIHYSSDAGSSWNIIHINNLSPSPGALFTATKINNGYIVAGSESQGVVRSIDNGSTFQSISGTTVAGNVARLDLAPWGDLFVSYDGGKGMRLINANSLIATTASATTLTNFPNTYSVYYNPLDVAFGQTNNIYVGTDNGFYSSADNGTSFNPNSTGLTSKKILRLRVNQIDGYLYLANGEGLFRSSSQVITGSPQTKNNQTISFSPLPSKMYGDSPFDITTTLASTSSGLLLSFTSSNTSVATISGNTITIKGAGNTTITATQSGNANYNAAPDVQQNLTVTKADQAIIFNPISPKMVGDVFDLLVQAGASGNPLTFTSSDTNVATISGNTVTVIEAGTTLITANQLGNLNYNAAQSIQQELVAMLVTGIEQTEVGEMEVYPNPVSDQLEINLNDIGEIVKVEILDMKGVAVEHGDYKMSEQKLSLPVSYLSRSIHSLFEIRRSAKGFTIH
jgi:hypothetical protein